MSELNSLQRKILREVYVLKGRDRRILVARNRAGSPVVVTIGATRMSSARAIDALTDLYQRGLVLQERLNRFKLSRAGLSLAKLLQGLRN